MMGKGKFCCFCFCFCFCSCLSLVLISGLVHVSLPAASYFMIISLLAVHRYITLDDISDLISTNDGTMDKEILDMWRDGMKTCKSSKDNDKMYFEDFEEVMKGCQRRKSSLVDGLRRSGSVRNYSSRSLFPAAAERHSKSTSQLETSIRLSGQLNDRLSSNHILTSTLAMRPLLPYAKNDSAIDETKSGEGGGMAVTGTTSIKAPRRSLIRGSAGSSTQGSTGGGALLIASRRQLSNLTPVAKKDST
jgi:hypothetical protein